MWANSGLVFVARVVVRGDEEEQSAIRFDAYDLRRLLLHRLEVLAAALHKLEDLRSSAAQGTSPR